MKRFLLFICIVFIEFALMAQTTPEVFLSMVPATPTNCCSMKQADKDAYKLKCSEFDKKIKAEIDRRKKASHEYMDKNSEAIKKGAIKQAGFDEATINQMKNATPEQQKAIADKMMKEKYNMSMADAQNLKNMTKEQQTAWAAAQGAKVAADAQANPEKYKTQSNQGMELMAVSQQITALNKKFKTKEAEFEQRINNVKNNPEAIKMRAEIEQLQTKLTGMMGIVTDASRVKMDQIGAQIKSLKKQYCSKFGPQYLVIVNDYQAYVKNTMPDFYKCEDLLDQQFQMQTGSKSPLGEKGLMGIEAVSRYADISSGILEFNLRVGNEVE
jgi:hypothetical protein